MKRVLLAVVVVALISAFLNPDLALNAEGLAIFLGFLAAIGVVLVAFELPALLVHHRGTGETGRMRVLPWAISWPRSSSSSPACSTCSRATCTASSSRSFSCKRSRPSRRDARPPSARPSPWSWR